VLFGRWLSVLFGRWLSVLFGRWLSVLFGRWLSVMFALLPFRACSAAGFRWPLASRLFAL
jgi:putative Ca2+/H+ antiporter (TMEM165/GDT1 family)